MPLSESVVAPLARAGYAARGLVYAVVGVMALLAAFGQAANRDDRGAIRVLLEQPLGVALLWLTFAGLVGYVVWRLVQAILDADRYGRDFIGLATRVGFLGSAISYGALAVFVLSVLGVLGGGEDERWATADAMAGFVGQRTVSLVLALAFLIVGGAHVYEAIAGRYSRYFNATARQMLFVRLASIAGLISRGVIFGVVGVLLFQRFLNAESAGENPPRTDDALAYVQSLPGGQTWLTLLALGVLAFAAYSFAQAIWRRIDID